MILIQIATALAVGAYVVLSKDARAARTPVAHPQRRPDQECCQKTGRAFHDSESPILSR